MSTRQPQKLGPAGHETIGSYRRTNRKFAPGLALTEAPGVVVVAILEPLTRALWDSAVNAAISHRTHPLDIAAIVMPSDSPPVPPRTVQRLAAMGVVIADAEGESAEARAENYVDALAAAQDNAREHLRSFVESVQQREGESR